MQRRHVGGMLVECRLPTRHNTDYRAWVFSGAFGVIVDVERLLEGEELGRLVELGEERGRVRDPS